MRISKKFAGKGIGKMVYLSKVNVVLRQNPEGFKNILKQLNESEQKFLQAALPTNNFLQVCLLYILLKMPATWHFSILLIFDIAYRCHLFAKSEVMQRFL